MSRVRPRTRHRRCLSACLAAIVLVVAAHPSLAAQSDDPMGQIAFVRNGDIWLWSPNGTEEVVTSGTATDPALSPGGDAVAYIERGGSFSNLVIFDRETGRGVRITDNEPFVESGSPDYVRASAWAIDPSWSASGRIGFISDRGSTDRVMRLWIMEAGSRQAAVAPADGQDAGSIEQLELSRDGDTAVYTVLSAGGELGGSTYVALRDLDSGATYPVAEGVRGAYDPALSPDGTHLVVSIRDEDDVSDLWMIDVETGRSSRLTEGKQATNAAWSEDGDRLAYMTPNDQSFTIWTSRIDSVTQTLAGEPSKLVEEPGIDATSGLSWIG